MAHDVISTCPVCEHELAVTRLHCSECGTTLEGTFSVGRFGRLHRDQLALLESFLRSRGNLREMERELGLSYPTIRGRVDALVKALGLGGPIEDQEASEPEFPESSGTDETSAGAHRRAVLERLARREISADEAAAALRAIPSPGKQPARQ